MSIQYRKLLRISEPLDFQKLIPVSIVDIFLGVDKTLALENHNGLRSLSKLCAIAGRLCQDSDNNPKWKFSVLVS